jgi:fused signal recognition particle receptor
VILTKADADARGGAALSIVYTTGKPILYLGVGQEYDDLMPFDPGAFMDSVLKAD